eukprot:scaffold28338_cov38-Cyclotella_meneghiniana.AAC.3
MASLAVKDRSCHRTLIKCAGEITWAEATGRDGDMVQLAGQFGRFEYSEFATVGTPRRSERFQCLSEKCVGHAYGHFSGVYDVS